MPQPSQRDRAIGALVGLAVGDAVGTTLEFEPRDREGPLTDMVGGGPFRLAPGEWTDDTSMALCLADSLLACDGFDGRDLQQRFCRWWRQGENSHNGRCFDIGVTTRQALLRFEREGVIEAGTDDPESAGNGSLMRLAPVSLRWWNTPTMARDVARKQSATTHRAPLALECCEAFADLLCLAIAGGDKEAVLSPKSWNVNQQVEAVLSGTWRDRPREEISSTGYVMHSFEAALWCIGASTDFSQAVLLAANLGNDADTTAAITGQLAGAIWGYSGIPQPWLDRLAWHDRIVSQAEALFDASA